MPSAAQRDAYLEVKRAMRAGTLVRQPCEICGSQATKAHHEDYGKPLEVRWLCERCHTLRHRDKTGNWEDRARALPPREPAPIIQPKGHLMIKQIAERTGLSAGYIRQALIAASLKGEKIGRDWLVADADLERWLSREHKRPGRPPAGRPTARRAPAEGESP